MSHNRFGEEWITLKDWNSYLRLAVDDEKTLAILMSVKCFSETLK